MLCILPFPSCYSNLHHRYHTISSAHLGISRLRPRISVFHTRSFAHLGIYCIFPSMPTTHLVFPLPSGVGSYCVPISPPILLLALAYHKSARVAKSYFSIASWRHHASLLRPPSVVPRLPCTHQIRELAPPTDPQLPVVSLCRSSPTGFPLPLLRLAPPASPISCLLIALFASL